METIARVGISEMIDPSITEALSASWLPTRYREIGSLLEQAGPTEFVQAMRHLCRTDLWFLMRVVFRRKDIAHPWLFARCMEVQAAPDGYLDLWARGHYKSSIITYAKTVQDILASYGNDPLPEWQGMEPTFGIFSHTRPIAKGFLRQIKQEFETNELLKTLFPDVLYANPESESPRWSEDAGIIVKRRTNPKESTVEAHGLVDGQPISKHFNVLVYDDTVTRESVATPEMNAKTLEAWELSLSLGDRNPRKRMIGTRYANADLYLTIMKRGVVIPRIYPATDDGTFQGNPIFLSKVELDQKIKEMGGGFVASAQLLLNPVADSALAFKREWLRYYREASNWRDMQRVLLVDPASDKKRRSDYTAMAVIGRGPDKKRYLLDAVRDRLNLQERAQMAMQLHRKWQPHRVGWEKYGMMADIEYMDEVQERENYRFHIEELGGNMAKVDRINRLMPPFSEGAYYLPNQLWRTLHDGKTVDVIQALIEEELLPWPLPVHDDLLDAMSREFDLGDILWPRAAEDPNPRQRYSDRESRGSWMAM